MHGYPNLDSNNGQQLNLITGGIYTQYEREGHLVVRSLLDTRKNSAGVSTTGPSNFHETEYGFNVKKESVSLTASHWCYESNLAAYSFGGQLTGGPNCSWGEYNQSYDFLFQGNNASYENYNQNYQFIAGLAESGAQLRYWNATINRATSSVWNRGLGNTNNSASQTSNSANATPLNQNSSYLLGLQSIAIDEIWYVSESKDTNTNRPQLQTSYRRANDLYGETIVLDNNSLQGARARTGHIFPNNLKYFTLFVPIMYI
jgi:hypothetical protein